MAADIKKIIKNLLDFYKFDEQYILSVGAGGGQFIEYAHNAAHVTAIDNDENALEKLEDNLDKMGLRHKFTLIHSDFYEVNIKTDVVLFEFCLHEMKDAEKAIEHALSLSQNIVVADHSPNSEWTYFADEKEKVIKSWDAVNKFQLKKLTLFDCFQYFKDYEELFQKLSILGEPTIERIGKFNGMKEISIPMPYSFALI